MKHILALLLLVTGSCLGQTKLSDRAEISVVTFGPGQQYVFTAFGHSAFRVNDSVAGIDNAYNYGVFDFDQPNFYLNFARGYLYYQLGVGPYPDFEYHYIYFNRYVHEQKLNLTAKQKQRLFDYLEWNRRPENKFYRYDYFYDNCATKMPDILSTVFGDTVRFEGSHIKTDYTIRELTDLYLKHQPWGDLGIDICLGLPMDKTASPYEYMFLPDYVEAGFANATVLKYGTTEPLVKERISVYESRPEDPPRTLMHPLAVFSIVFLLLSLLSYRDIRRNRLTNIVDIIFFSTLGLLGILLLMLWWFTDHQAAARNLNLLWALPTHLVAVIAFAKKPRWLSGYFLAIAIVSLLLLLSWPILPQKLHYALIPLVMAIGMRSYTQYWVRKQELSQEMTTPAPGLTER